MTDWEDEQEKVRLQQEDISAQISYWSSCFSEVAGKSYGEVALFMDSLVKPDAEYFGERFSEGLASFDKCVATLKQMHDAQLALEQKIQAEREQKIAEEAVEKVRAEAELKIKQAQEVASAAKIKEECAERARIAAEQQAAHAKIDAENARIQAERNAKIMAEQTIENERKQAAEIARLEKEEADRKAANKEHRRQVNNAALSAFISTGISDNIAKKVIMAIANGQIPNITINY